MMVMWLAWLTVPFGTLAVLVYIAQFVTRWQTHREIDQAYEQLCTETARDIW